MPDASGSIAVLMTVHNRCGTTCACLALLLPQLRACDRVFVVDDGSTDGTSEMLKGYSASDKRVRIICGSGNLYWAQGMSLAWEAAGAGFAGYLWLNDDAMLKPGAVKKFLDEDSGDRMLIGQLVDSVGKEVYGLNVNGWVNGNCVYVPRGVMRSVGMICGEYAHAWADSDYAMRAKRAGISIAGCGVVGTTEWHPLRPDLGAMCLRERWHSLFAPKGWNLHDLWLYRKRNWGCCAAIASCVHFVIHVLIGK